MDCIMTRKRIAIVTTKQPGTNPRMRKNADALSAAGHDVHVYYAYTADWADKQTAQSLEKPRGITNALVDIPQKNAGRTH